MSGGVKFRRVVAWMAAMLLLASLALAHVWKQNTHARLSRELAGTERKRDALAAEVLRLEAETRALGQYSRVEAVARRRLGLVNPGPSVMILAGDRVPDDRRAPIRASRWKGVLR